MSNTNGQVSFVKSMNGILSFNTGSGTIISGDTITTDNLDVTNFNTNNLQGITPSDNITLYTNSTGDIHIGSANSANYINGLVIVDNIFTSTTSTNPFIYPNTSGDITIGSIVAPVIGDYVCTASNHLANKGYVDSVGINLLPLTNIWTGVSNTFNNNIIGNTITATAVGSTVNLFDNITTGTINIGNNINNSVSGSGINIGVSPNNSAIIIGNNTGTVGVGELTLRTLGSMNVGKFASEMNVGTGMTTGIIKIGSALTTGYLQLGEHTQTGNIEIRSANVIAIGNFASTINIGLNTGSINIGTNQTLSTDRINIGNLTGGLAGMNLGAKTINIGLNSTSIQIGNSMTAGVGINIGNNAITTNIRGATIDMGDSTSTFLLKTPITPTYDTLYTAFAGTPSGCIGNYVFPNITIGNFDLTSTINKVGATFTNLEVGVWLLYWNAYFFVPTTNAVITSITLNMGETSGSGNLLATVVECATITLAVGRTKSYSITQIYTNVSSAQDIYFSVTAVFTGTLRILGLFSGSNCKAVRIA
jgi:hypothetical protein